ncbi:kinase-like domain-containing protein [Penicillium malachiteum]|uniref:Kinase-like domain-containing protein n=1 Tax=Penicillium malachiteum TaxID=1324776 RepID=A0AAD6HUG7_9EURO|nr:kinase-like domain-containing protein [Penicillium malachiteum]
MASALDLIVAKGDGTVVEGLLGPSGPDIVAYSNAIVDAGLAKLPPTDLEPQSLERHLPFYQGSVETHVQLLKHTRIVLTQMASDTKVKFRLDPMLFHRELQLRHIFVLDEDLTVITGIIDWQSARFEPAFLYSFSTRDFVPKRMETATGSEQKFTETAESRTEEVESKSQSDPNSTEADKSSELLQRSWDTVMSLYVPQISVARATHVGLFPLFRICDDSCYDGALKLQNELAQLRRKGNWLGFSGECPYPQQSDRFLTRHTDRDDLYELVTSMREDLV